MSLHKLVFDTTDSNTILDSHSVGAHVRAGKGGAIITYHGDQQANSATDAFVPGDVTAGSDTITLTAHAFNNGDKVRFTTDDTLPDPLATLTDYWVIFVDANTIKVAASQADAELGIAIDLIDGGTGNHTITAQPYDIRAMDVHVVNPLDVNIISPVVIDVDLDGVYSGGNTDPDNVGVIVHARAATPGDTDQTFRTTGGIANADAVVAANVHGADVNSYNMVYNGSTWDRLTGTNGAMNVSDAALANSTLIATPKALLASTATDVISSPLPNRKYLWLYNNHNREMYIGGTGVTVATGLPLPVGSLLEMRAGAAVVVRAISEAATTGDRNLRTMELS